MILNFKEISQANQGDGLQDTFELLCRDILEDMGFEIKQHPDRGADGKKDLIVTENRKGILGVTQINWLVSCKHFAHSGKSVSDTDEPDINDRLKAHQCEGFMGFYSTIPATSLTTKLKTTPIQNSIYDRERIEKFLLTNSAGNKIAKRYFPKSYKGYLDENPKPANLFHKQQTIKCQYCNKDLLESKSGMFVFLKNYENMKEDSDKLITEDVYFSCKGECDTHLRSYYYSKSRLTDSGWDDITNLLNPIWWLHNAIFFLERDETPLRHFSEEAFQKMKQLFIRTFPFVSRELTTEEKAFITEDDYMNIF